MRGSRFWVVEVGHSVVVGVGISSGRGQVHGAKRCRESQRRAGTCHGITACFKNTHTIIHRSDTAIVLSKKHACDVVIRTVYGHLLLANGLSDVQSLISKTQPISLRQRTKEREKFIYN